MLPVPAAYLRVYEPLASLPAEERRRWEEVVAAGAAADRATVTLREFEALWPAYLAPDAVADVTLEEAFVMRVDGETYVCPWRTRLRSFETLLGFREGLPDVIAEAYCPAVVAERVETELDGWRRLHPGIRPTILTSPWVVPVRWFAAFEPVERTVVVRRGAARAMSYQAGMGRVRRRLTRALGVVRQSFGPGGPTAELEVLSRWLEQFHPRSVLELDYGRIVDLMTDEEMRADESAGDVMDSVDALAHGDGERAGEAYGRLMQRWQPFGARERAS